MFAGLLTYSDAQDPNDWVSDNAWKEALYPFAKPDIIGHWSKETLCLTTGGIYNTPWLRHAQRLPFRAGKHVAAFWGRLDNRLELGKQLEMNADLDAVTDEELVLRAWRQWGEDLPGKLLGDFALAVIDMEKRRLFLTRDPLGVKPLYYWPHAQGFLFATTVAAFRCLKNLQPTPDSDWMARYMLHMSMSHDRTGYREILKLPAGHHLTVTAQGPGEPVRWHHWRDDAPLGDVREKKWQEAFLATMQQAVDCRMVSDYPLGTENSGGLDSACVTAFAAAALGSPGDRLHSFGFVFDEHEPEAVLATSQYRDIRHNHLITSAFSEPQQLQEQIQRSLKVCGYPIEHGSGDASSQFFRECRKWDIRTMLSGFGGDEVSSNPGYQLRYELLDAGRYRDLWTILPGNLLWRFLRLGKAVTVGRKNKTYNPRFHKSWKQRWPCQPLRRQVVERLNLEADYWRDARYDAPYRRVNSWIIDGLLTMPYIPTRLENCTLVAASYGIEYRWPLWDVRLVQQYLSTPGIEKVGPGGVHRYLHRSAMSSVAPPNVAWKPKKAMGVSRIPARLRARDLQQNITLMRHHEANLHPALEQLLDRGRWLKQVDLLAQDKLSGDGAFMMGRSLIALQNLNYWLHDGPIE